jgi:hypothetical protein
MRAAGICQLAAINSEHRQLRRVITSDMTTRRVPAQIAESERVASRLASGGASGQIHQFWVSLPWMGGPGCRIGWVLGAEPWLPAGGVPVRTSA